MCPEAPMTTTRTTDLRDRDSAAPAKTRPRRHDTNREPVVIPAAGETAHDPVPFPTMQIALVVGNPKAASRTSRVAQAVGAAVAAGLPGDTATEVIELAEIGGRLFDWGDAEATALSATVAAADVVVVACPTYKATYTGLLKAFLDRYGSNGLAGVTAVAVMVGAAPIHALAPETYLRPLLVELGASVPSRALYVLESQLDDLAAVVDAWAATAVPLITAVAGRNG
ncbi:MAG TPA: NAD(P)H-dependent oxidoreductase [Acidimicrobiales bacterium]